MLKIITIIGARPQIIKSSALSRAIRTKFSEKIEEVIVHTGQHYDENMSAVFFEEMSIPRPSYNLSVGSGNHGAQTAKMLEGLEEIYLKEKPHAVVVYGDTNSTIAGALAAIKIHIPVVHIEAGLRSFNKAMPEEVNRIACDHMSTMLFTPTRTGLENLQKEGFSMTLPEKVDADHPAVFHCGDIMYDNTLHFSSISEEKSSVLSALGLSEKPYVLGTIHRDNNTDIPERLTGIFSALLRVQESTGYDIVLPLHPRTRKKMVENLSTEVSEKLKNNPKIKLIDPAGFLDILHLEKNCQLMITDSGGLQKEAFFVEKPCVILREQTEWVEIVNNGNAILTGSDEEKIVAAVSDLMNRKEFTYPKYYGDGHAAEFICEQILRYI